MIKYMVLIGGIFFSGSVLSQDFCSVAEKDFNQEFNVYKKDGNAAFLKSMVAGGPLETDTSSLEKMKILTIVEKYLGNIESLSIFSRKQLGNKTCYLSAVLEYHGGPILAFITYYDAPNSPTITSINIETNIQKMLAEGFFTQ
ncbi:hypothetical protein VV869_18475 [Photobacterium sp. MCCC 1A19761]|uniref:hypothetical protein n=1 Tax=Photobacterium sp. MCCC 1A19761 TaxID=3115000 RepID=UPI00307F8FD4